MLLSKNTGSLRNPAFLIERSIPFDGGGNGHVLGRLPRPSGAFIAGRGLVPYDATKLRYALAVEVQRVARPARLSGAPSHHAVSLGKPRNGPIVAVVAIAVVFVGVIEVRPIWPATGATNARRSCYVFG